MRDVEAIEVRGSNGLNVYLATQGRIECGAERHWRCIQLTVQVHRPGRIFIRHPHLDPLDLHVGGVKVGGVLFQEDVIVMDPFAEPIRTAGDNVRRQRPGRGAVRFYRPLRHRTSGRIGKY